MSYAVGCLLRKGKKADDDGDVVRLLRKAGAIIVGITNQPELCMSPETFNFVTGLTRNPYDQHRTVGGTSGGEVNILLIITTNQLIVIQLSIKLIYLCQDSEEILKIIIYNKLSLFVFLAVLSL